MKIQTKRFAALEIDENKIILMQKGILGFEDYKRFFLLMPSAGEPLMWLQAVDEPALAFVVANPCVIKGDYEPAIMENDLELLDIKRGEDIVLLAIVTVHSQPLRVTANLRAPILINAVNRKANQIVLDEPTYPIQYLVLESQQHTDGGRLDKLYVAMGGKG